MDASRQLLLGTGVFLGGGMLLFAMVKQMDSPQQNVEDNTPKVTEVSTADNNTAPLTADVETEERVLEKKRLERERKEAELNKRAREFLSEQEKAEMLAMQKARDENEQYRSNAAEPIIEEKPEQAESATPITKPVVTPRRVETEEQPKTTAQAAQVAQKSQEQTQSKPADKKESASAAQQAPSKPQSYTVQRGDSLIKLARRYNVPVEALSQANKISGSTLRVGQELTVPSRSQIDRLVSDYNSSKSSANKSSSDKSTQQTKAEAKPEPEKKSNPAPTNSAPPRQLDYKVQRGDGLIKLARQYNVPVEALAEANNMSSNTSLRVGQELTIPSRKQVARLQREAEERRAAEANKRDAQQRLAEARREAARGEAKGTFGVQVALADNQDKADEVVAKLKAAGYSASTSRTSRGVRVIVGPEKGKEAALALKDKINADSRTGVNNAWVLYWR